MLLQLKNRFREAGINRFKVFAADLSKPETRLPAGHFDLVIADLPCSGSGTWGRNPESLYFFKPGEIIHYSSLQRKIISTVVPTLKKGGSLLYSTCSVFKKENEEIREFTQRQFGLQIVCEALLTGYQNRADSLYASLFRV